jgi:hypothetical protein
MAKRGPKLKKEIVWSQDIAYGVGLIATGGCLLQDGRHLAFTSKDPEQIENIRKCFAVTSKTQMKRSGRKEDPTLYYHLQWGDITLYSFLFEIGLTPRKSLTLGALKIPDNFFFDFLRGAYDGDGCFYSYFDSRWKSSFMFYLTFSSASPEHTIWLQKVIQRLCNVNGHVTHTGKNGRTLMHNLKYAKAETLVILARMYENPAAVCLSRKRLKIVDVLSIVSQSLPGC